MSSGPPPVPGGRSPEEREAARREREARRSGRRPDPVMYEAPAPPAPEATDGHARPDWLTEARRLTNAGPPRPRAERARSGGRRWGRLAALGIVLAVLLAAAWFANAVFQPFKGEGDGGAVRVQIPQGSTLSQIADRLEQTGVISNAGFFELRARLAGRSGDLKPGSYELRRDMSFAAALDVLERGVPPNVVQVSIPEGLSRSEIAPLTEGLEGNYVRATRRSPELDPADYGAEGARNLEGFLFPATYELKKGQRVNRLVEQQLAHFKRTFDRVDMSFARRRNLTRYDVLIIASLIERETLVASERRLVSSVIYNRLRDDIRLGIDATVRFLTGNWSEPLKVSELENPSPYNTRLHFGLPPGPIGNPGLASIRAAAQPARTDYLFYVAAVCGEGKHKFAETDAEFQRYVDEYNTAREERGGESPTSC